MEHPGSLANALRALREYGFQTVVSRHMCERAAYAGSCQRHTGTYVITVTFDRERGYAVWAVSSVADVPADDDSHEVRESPTRIRPYQARTVHYLGRLVYVCNAGVGNRVDVFTLHGTYGPSPSRLVCQSYRSR